MSNRATVQESIHVFNEVVKRRFVNPNDWIILNRPNCLDIYCKSVIYIQDREIIKHYFPNSEICLWAWQNNLKLRNLVHLIHKGQRERCKFCKATFQADAKTEYRLHVLKYHISKGKYGQYTNQLSMKNNIKPESVIKPTTEIFIE